MTSVRLASWRDFPLSDIGPQDLLVFDVDQVLIDPQDAILSGSDNEQKNSFFKDLEQRLGLDKANWLYSILIRDRKCVLTEPEVCQILVSLQNRAIDYLALTAFPSGPFGVIPDIMEHRYQQLLSLGLEFNHSFKSIGRTVLSDIAQDLQVPRVPSFDRGILYTGQGGFGAKRVQKATVLASFLKYHQLSYPKIWFIDDQIGHLRDMAAWAQSQSQALAVFHYLGAAEARPGLNEAQARRQFAHLEKYEHWLGDSQ